MSTIIITPMAGPFGATVGGVDVSGPLDDVTAKTIVDGLFDHRILLIEHQELEPAEYVRFGRAWGEPISFFVPEHRNQQHPELIRIRNSPTTPPESRDGAMHWHSDSSYEAEPAWVTTLYAIEAPADGNDTLFADTTAAYEALPDEMKERIAELRVTHDPRGGRVNLEGEVRGRGRTEPLPLVDHPLVVQHPVTGGPALFGFSGTATGIVGWDDAAAIELLIELKRHVLQDRFRQRAKADVGSILIWDNYQVVHSATPTIYSDKDGERRLLHRISTRGLPPVYRTAGLSTA
jgi:taurine dioxygenase